MPDPLAEVKFAVCVANDECDDLSVGMLYRVLAGQEASVEGLLRIVDDSGEDDLYPANPIRRGRGAPGRSPEAPGRIGGNWCLNRQCGKELRAYPEGRR